MAIVPGKLHRPTNLVKWFGGSLRLSSRDLLLERFVGFIPYTEKTAVIILEYEPVVVGSSVGVATFLTPEGIIGCRSVRKCDWEPIDE